MIIRDVVPSAIVQHVVNFLLTWAVLYIALTWFTARERWWRR